MRDMNKAANYQTAFPQGPVTNNGLMISAEWQRSWLTLWNRTGGALGVDMTYQVGQISLAINTAQTAQKTATQAEENAQEAIKAAASAEQDAQTAIKSASQAEEDAQSALKAVEDVLIMTLLTSSAQVAKTAQSLDDAALMAAQSQIWPSQLLQSSQA